jgi:hypothetical protein
VQVINVPKFNDDGSVECVMLINPVEAQQLLQFAVNFLAGTGHRVYAERSAQLDLPFDTPVQ